jgi:hypothetical protein
MIDRAQFSRLMKRIDALIAAYNAAAKKNETAQKPKNNFLEKLTAWGVATYTVITFFILIISFCQFRSSEQGGRDQLRAYVYAVSGGVFNVSINKRPEPYIAIVNNGRTFAKDVKIWASARVSRRLSKAEEIALGNGDEEPGTAIITPNIPLTIIRHAEQLKTDDDVAKIIDRAGTLLIYVFGRIEYSDAFDGPHHTEFCFVHYGEPDNFPANGGQGFNRLQAKACEGHNNTK